MLLESSKVEGYLRKVWFGFGTPPSFLVLNKNKEPRVSFHIEKINKLLFFKKIIRFLKLEIIKYFMT